MLQRRFSGSGAAGHPVEGLWRCLHGSGAKNATCAGGGPCLFPVPMLSALGDLPFPDIKVSGFRQGMQSLPVPGSEPFWEIRHKQQM